MTLENLDLLLLTETHAEELSPSLSSAVLGQAGMPSKAGVALITRRGSSWEALSHEVLVPGYAFIASLRHKQSREQFWFLGVYGDTSGGYLSLKVFLELLRERLTKFISSLPGGVWPGCIAAGDWNFVEHSGDRFPFRESHTKASPLVNVFNDIRRICRMADCAGDRPSLRQWSYSKMTANGRTFSRLDRIYRPSSGWSNLRPVPIATNWSDHRVITTTLMVLRPRVEKAIPAPRLPSVDVLDKSDRFWKQVVTMWRDATKAGPMRLERWMAFKGGVLAEGLAVSRATKKNGGKDWLKALREENLHPTEIGSAMYKSLNQLHARPAPPARRRPIWAEAVPARGKPPRRIVAGPRSGVSSPWGVPTRVPMGAHTSGDKGDAAPELPHGAPRSKGVADMLDGRAAFLASNTKRKAARMAKNHTSEWFRQSSNKELDERGSRASVSVEGLHRPLEASACTDLREMASVARDYFTTLHSPEPLTPDRTRTQRTLLRELRAEYSARPDPESLCSGPFSLQEAAILRKKMPNTAPGPDGIHYGFWKSLITLLDSQQKLTDAPKAFWLTFLELTDDLRERGTSRLGFKDANVSLFFKKGDPTLVSNYRPISSMNTDCKMYTNLVNARLAPWAVCKLHDDQKGFVPGRQMKEHTRLATEVAHLCDASDTPGFIVSLDQAKAYDRVDQEWLLLVMKALGLPGDLLVLIEDIISGCRSRVRINSGYSGKFTLRRGVRQGDPLSCLLFNFSIEPLAMRLRSVVSGLSTYGLPPVKVMLYADDINLFLSTMDSVPLVNECLHTTSYAIGSSFNLEKTDVKPVGPHDFRLKCFTEQSMAGHIIPGAYVLPPGSPLRILGVWVDSRDLATQRWAQIDAHVSKIIRQWRLIGASALNRTVLAKALMLSKCHFLMDGNGIPAYYLGRIGNKIQRFVRGNMSSMAYQTLEAPVEEGGLNCPSLSTRKKACDLRFLSELISGPQNVPWKKWVWKDIKLASFTCARSKESGLHPFLQRAHVKPSLLQDRLRQAYSTAQAVGLDLLCVAPSQAAQCGALALYHLAIHKDVSRSSRHLAGLGIRTVGDVYGADLSGRHLRVVKPMLKKIIKMLSDTAWSPAREHNSHMPGDGVRVWPGMSGPLGCIRVFTPNSLLTTVRQTKAAADGNS